MWVYSQQGDTIDEICWRAYGQTEGMVEAVLLENPNLVNHGAVLPISTPINLPPKPDPATKQVDMIQLWN